MVYVSKHAVAPVILSRINKLLFAHIARLNVSTKAERFLEELLSDTERLMLAKRIAILVLLEQGYTYRVISRALKVTEVTISKYDRRRKKGVYDFLLKELRSIKYRKGTFWDELEKLMQAGLPPRGKGRWEHVFRHDSQ